MIGLCPVAGDVCPDRSQDLPDVRSFLEEITRSTFFQAGLPIHVSRAPGRLDVMGGIADYSGSLVLQLPLREATFAAVQRVDEPILTILSHGGEVNGRTAEFTLPMADLPTDYAEARARFARDSHTAWAAYVAGTLLVLAQEKGLRLSGGVRILLSSNVPEGKGVSSSAAIEVAMMQAACSAFGVILPARDLALLCQLVENEVVGAPCGVMDQMTSAAGHAGHLLALLCQPAEVQGHLPLPKELAFWGIDSGVRHSVSGADYGSVRVGAFMGYRIIAQGAGLAVYREGVRTQVEDPGWNGYLANISPSEFEQRFAMLLPEQMTGAEFLALYGGTTDFVTQVDPQRIYAVRVPTAHPVYEHCRVRTFAELLSGWEDATEGRIRSRLDLLGELMYQSHASYSACGLGSAATDRLVDLARSIGPAQGVYGAKITGGGSGGTVAILARAEAETAVRKIAEQYAEETGGRPYVFEGSSPGSAEFGTLEVMGASGV